jgi:hypothetical protein
MATKQLHGALDAGVNDEYRASSVVLFSGFPLIWLLMQSTSLADALGKLKINIEIVFMLFIYHHLIAC